VAPGWVDGFGFRSRFCTDADISERRDASAGKRKTLRLWARL